VAKELFCFWINDDADSGDIAEGNSDVPGQGGKWNPLKKNANYTDKVLNGRSDLTDFFPVWLRLESALDAYPPGGDIEYRLSHAGKALRFVYTDLAREEGSGLDVRHWQGETFFGFIQPWQDRCESILRVAFIMSSVAVLSGVIFSKKMPIMCIF